MSAADNIMADLRRRRDAAFEQLATEVRDDLQELVSVKVSRSRSGNRRITIRSKPGEAPRSDTDRYRKSIRQAVNAEADRISAKVFTNSPIGRYLEEGTDTMAARPHWSVIREKWRGRAAQRVRELMFG